MGKEKILILSLVFARLVLLRKPLKIVSLVDNKFMTKEGEFRLNGNENSDIEMENVLDNKGSPRMKIFNKNDQVLNANGKYLKWEKQDNENESLWIYTPVGNIGGTISDGEGNCFLRKEQSISLSECSKEIDNLSKDYLYKVEIIEKDNKSEKGNEENPPKSTESDNKDTKNNVSSQENSIVESKANQGLKNMVTSYDDKEEKYKKPKEENFDGAEELFEDQNIKIIRKHPYNTESMEKTKAYLYREEPILHYQDSSQLYQDPHNFQDGYNNNAYSKQRQRSENHSVDTAYRRHSHGFNRSELPVARLYKPYEQSPYNYKDEIHRDERNKFYREPEYYKPSEYSSRDYITNDPQKDFSSRRVLDGEYKINDAFMGPDNNNGSTPSTSHKKDTKSDKDLDESLKILMQLIEKFKKTKENAANKQKA